jgi:hypothetical protein
MGNFRFGVWVLVVVSIPKWEDNDACDTRRACQAQLSVRHGRDTEQHFIANTIDMRNFHNGQSVKAPQEK